MTAMSQGSLTPGTVATARSWPAGFETWNRYAAVNDEFYPVHMEHKAACAAGMPGAFGMGNLQAAYVNALLTDWIHEVSTAHPGTNGHLARVSLRFHNPSLHGHVLATATIRRTEHRGTTTIWLDVSTRDQDGRDLCAGNAVVTFDARG